MEIMLTLFKGLIIYLNELFKGMDIYTIICRKEFE